jgi:uncharacterized membrane protein (DUF106 family)
MVGQVSEKEEELMRVKLELSKHQQQVLVKSHVCFLTFFSLMKIVMDVDCRVGKKMPQLTTGQ